MNSYLCHMEKIFWSMVVALLVALSFSVMVQAEHECHYDENKNLVCPNHEQTAEDEQEPSESQEPQDRDRDGISDDEDQCPNEAGLPDSPDGAGCPESSDTTSEGEDLDIDLDQSSAPNFRFECVITSPDEELCLFQIFLSNGHQLDVVRVEDRCDPNGGLCQRTQDRLLCDLDGRNCRMVELRIFEEICDLEGGCVRQLIIDQVCDLTMSEVCTDRPILSVGAVPSAESLRDHSLIVETRSECTEDGTMCISESFICTPSGCRRVTQRMTFRSMDCDPRCESTTYNRVCDSDSCHTASFTVSRSWFEEGLQDESTTFVCDMPLSEDDLNCDEVSRTPVSHYFHAFENGGETTSTTQCDPTSGEDCERTYSYSTFESYDKNERRIVTMNCPSALANNSECTIRSSHSQQCLASACYTRDSNCEDERQTICLVEEHTNRPDGSALTRTTLCDRRTLICTTLTIETDSHGNTVSTERMECSPTNPEDEEPYLDGRCTNIT